jgi:hypothetical protein
MVKVHWTCYGPKDATWEHEDAMQEEYPHLFGVFLKNFGMNNVYNAFRIVHKIRGDVM